MRKLLILVLVLGMASMASATLQISVNGDKEPVDSEIVIAPSDMLTLDVWTDTAISAGVGEWAGWALVVSPALGSISGGVSLYPTEPGIVLYDDAAGNGFPVVGENGVWGMIGITGVIPNVPADAVIYDLIQFHCEGLGDAVINLYGTQDWVSTTLLDTVIIHQIPEPATIALLGLGGLLLRRRK